MQKRNKGEKFDSKPYKSGTESKKTYQKLPECSGSIRTLKI